MYIWYIYNLKHYIRKVPCMTHLAISFSICFPPQESDSRARDTAAAYGTGRVRVGLGPGCWGWSDSYVIPGSPEGPVTSVNLRWEKISLNTLCTAHDPDVIPSGEFDSLRLSPRPGEDGLLSPRSPSPFQPLRSPSPREIHLDTTSISSCPEMVGHTVREE